jgi:hypothetical protein
MEMVMLMGLAALIAFVQKNREQSRRIALLAEHLRAHPIENLMGQLIEGYLRALGESDASRRESIWQLLNSQQAALADQLQQLHNSMARSDAQAWRTSRLPLALPWINQLLPDQCFDLRQLMAVHSRGIAEVHANAEGLSPRDQAFRMSAELFLFQHSCHWFCRSQAVASARLVMRHQTPHQQVLASVSPNTRTAYQAITGLS